MTRFKTIDREWNDKPSTIPGLADSNVTDFRFAVVSNDSPDGPFSAHVLIHTRGRDRDKCLYLADTVAAILQFQHNHPAPAA